MEKSTYFCGVDVAKNFFVTSVKNGRFLAKNRTFTIDKDGSQDFEEVIKKVKKKGDIGMEPTGIYHNKLLNFFEIKGYNSGVVNPYMLHFLYL
ncbi:MAG: hypothetical protein B6D56_08215 [Candidatus Omnitrophica bacterium 4484_70.1]|nr:MAG: hypothetical protein B6D56_08215 [Candidatus Omnitrophica bacterium 4484_70.1]